ncbi:uncharacterized protein LOC118647695 [Monomorium pharaonis]|uniref:uncharacterized protein LOC118647695 n=1 Tax=Monomorium pharaonis TaxID=307658 RepID=UPI0017470001|nr:uncharacterized protein LOC118647695 [Monomorium pharaonis]
MASFSFASDISGNCFSKYLKHFPSPLRAFTKLTASLDQVLYEEMGAILSSDQPKGHPVLCVCKSASSSRGGVFMIGRRRNVDFLVANLMLQCISSLLLNKERCNLRTQPFQTRIMLYIDQYEDAQQTIHKT